MNLAAVSQWLQQHVRTLPTVAPAPGANVVVATKGEEVGLVLAARATLVTSAVVSQRVLTLEYLDGDNNIVTRAKYNGSSAASTTTVADFSLLYGGPAGIDVTFVSAGLPLVPLLPGWSLRFAIFNGDVGDQLSVIRFTILRFPTGGVDWLPGDTP